MKKTFKILGIVVLLLLVVLIALPFIFKDKIAEQIRVTANETLNAELAFDDLSLSLISDFPNATLKLEKLTIDGMEEFAGVRLVDIGMLKATIDVMSLFGETIQIKEITLQDGDIDVRVLADGKANYDLMKSTDEAVTEEDAGEEESAFGMKLQGYSIVNTNIKYDDQTMPMTAIIKNLNHSGSGDFTADRTILETQTSMESFDLRYDGVRFLKEAAVKMAINLDLDLANMNFVFAENTIDINDLAMAIDGSIKMPNDDMDIDIKYSTTETDFKSLLSLVPAEFASDLGGVDVDGTMSFAGFIKGTFGASSLPGFGLDVKVENGRFNYPDLPKSVEKIQLIASIDASNGNNLDAAVLNIERFYMEMAGNPLDMHLRLSQPLSDPNIDCKLQAKIVLDNIKDIVPMAEGETLSGSINADVMFKGKLSTIEKEDYENFDAQGQIILQQLKFRSADFMYPIDVDVAYMNFTPKQLNLTQFEGKIGVSDISAVGKIDNYLAFALRDDLLQGDFNMSSRLLDLNELMGEEEAATESTGGADTTTTELLEVPGNIDFLLRSKFDKVLYDDVVIENVSGNIAIKDHVADLRNVNMDVLGGHVILDGKYSTLDPTVPKIDLSYNIQKLNIAKTAEKFNTVEKLAPIAASCEGSFSTDLKLMSNLDSQMELIETSMNGSGTMNTHSVKVNKFVPLTKLAEKLGLSKLANPTVSDVRLSYKIQDGKAIIAPFVVKLDGIETEIAGSTSLISEEIDYTMKMDVPFEKLPTNLVGQASSWVGQLNSQLGTSFSIGDKIPVNIRVTGTVDNPKLTTNYGDVAKGEDQTIKDQIVDEVKEQVQEVIEDTKEKARAEAKAQADKIMADAKKESAKLVDEGSKAADKVRKAANAEADKLENKGANFVEKAANKVASTTMRKEADKAYDKAVAEAKKQGDNLVAAAQKEADAVLKSTE
jgi:uncharacterized protein involved in outer membrane biogenesis